MSDFSDIKNFVEALIRGHYEAWDYFLKKYGKDPIEKAIKKLYFQLNCYAYVEDCLSEVISRINRKLHKYLEWCQKKNIKPNDRNFCNWLRTVSHNTAINFYKDFVSKSPIDIDDIWWIFDTNPLSDTQYSLKELFDIISKILSRDEDMVIKLKRFGLTQKEIAKFLGISLKRVRLLEEQAIKKLTDYFAGGKN